jgi:hypothetical protein
MARNKGILTGPPADPTTILRRLTPEERGWFLDLSERLRKVHLDIESIRVASKDRVVSVQCVQLGNCAICYDAFEKLQECSSWVPIN